MRPSRALSAAGVHRSDGLDYLQMLLERDRGPAGTEGELELVSHDLRSKSMDEVGGRLLTGKLGDASVQLRVKA